MEKISLGRILENIKVSIEHQNKTMNKVKEKLQEQQKDIQNISEGLTINHSELRQKISNVNG